MIAEAHFVTPEEIMACLDGELTGERADSVAAHMLDCPHCQEMSGILRDASRTLAAWTVEPPASDSSLEQRLSEMAAKSSSAKGFLGRFRAGVFTRPRPLFAFALGATAFIALVFMFLVSTRRPSQLAGNAASHAGGGDSLALSYSGAPPVPSAEFRESFQKAKEREPLDAAKTEYLRQVQAPQVSSNLANPPAEPQPPLTRGSQPMIARSVTLSIVAKDFAFSRTSLDAILARHHGYAATLTANTQENAARSLQASLRIPAAQLNAAVAELKLLGRVENESQTGEEVTQQHADLVARLKNSRETEQRLQAILLQRTGKMSDVLEVEQEIARVRGEIEQMEGEQKSLEHRVDFATIDLNLAEEYKAQIDSPSPSISTRFHNALVAGYRAAVESAVGVVLFVAEDGPVAFLWLVFLAPLAWFLRRRWVRSTSLIS